MGREGEDKRRIQGQMMRDAVLASQEKNKSDRSPASSPDTKRKRKRKKSKEEQPDAPGGIKAQ